MFWTFPMKPMRIRDAMLSTLRLSDYTMEKKYDGFRAMLIVEGGECKLFTRQKVAMAMPDNLKPQLEALKLPEGTVMDGELWTPTSRGSWREDRKVVCSLSLWDLVAVGGRSIGELPIEQRRAMMGDLVGAGTTDVKLVEWETVTKERIEEIRKEATDHKESSHSRSGFVHGVVLKRNESPRRDSMKRSVEHPDWMKIVFWDQN